MNAAEWAERLDGREYRKELLDGEREQLRDDQMVVIVGYSDDIVALHGHIEDEVDAYDGTVFMIDGDGVKPEWESGDSKTYDEAEDFFDRFSTPEIQVVVAWGGDTPWHISARFAGLPIAAPEFGVMEDGDVFCVGIVLDLSGLIDP